MSDLGIRIKQVAASRVIQAYADFRRHGKVADPEAAAAAYAEIRQVLDFLEGYGIADLEYSGADLIAIINEARNGGEEKA